MLHQGLSTVLLVLGSATGETYDLGPSDDDHFPVWLGTQVLHNGHVIEGGLASKVAVQNGQGCTSALLPLACSLCLASAVSWQLSCVLLAVGKA